MAIDVEIILRQARSLLREFDNFQCDYSPCPGFQLSGIITKQLSVIERLTPIGSVYRRNADAAVSRWGPSNQTTASRLIGIVGAIVDDYEQGYLQGVQELIHADLFNDFLEMADYLLSEGFKDASAVLVGSVLEGHLRQLCVRNGVATTQLSRGDQRPKKADTMNSELAAANAYGKLDQKNVTAWLDLRNQAAHGHYEKYTKEQVAVMLQGVRDFMARHLA